MSEQYVISRDGTQKPVDFNKITTRIKRLCKGLSDTVDPVLLTQKVIASFESGMKTSKIDALSAEIAASLASEHPDYLALGARIAVSNLHDNTTDNFKELTEALYKHKDPKTQEHKPIVSQEIYNFAKKYEKEIEKAIDYDRDNNFNYFGFRTLEKGGYLLKVNGIVAERPQHMYMRVSIGIHGNNLSEVLSTYDVLSKGLMTHATPTMYHAGTDFPQMASCFLLTMTEDSITGIFDSISKFAEISKYSGGIGVSITGIRGEGSYIQGSNGYSSGCVPMLRVINETASYVNQGGRRKGSIAVYMEPWHRDIVSFLEMKKNRGDESRRARDLFYALWIPDLFMRRVEENGTWTLMCPNECKGLMDVYGEEFEELYAKYENEGKGVITISARELWLKIIESQMETGTPYMLYKDHVNRKNNQANLGTIRNSNLCTEIMEYTSSKEVAMCNLASVALPKFVNVKDRSFDYKALYEVARKAIRNLNDVIDRSHYVLEESKKSNFAHRPVGLGVQGLADVFIKLRFPYDSVEAKTINKNIFETMYFAALTESNELAKKHGSYKSYKGSPLSKGVFQYEMWGLKDSDLSGMWDWKGLREQILKHGARNSLLIAPMPTASTAQILGNVEAFEPISSCLYVRRVLSGEFIVALAGLYNDLIERGLWNEEMRQQLIMNNGSIQDIPNIPDELKQIYRTAYEIPMKSIIDMAADRGAFIDQSQSLNLFVSAPTEKSMTSMHFYAWRRGLKTGMYYLRTKPAANAIKFTVNNAKINVQKEDKAEKSYEDQLQEKIENVQEEVVPETQAELIKENKSPTLVKIEEVSKVANANANRTDEDDGTPKNACISCGS